jgi:undecaprenyl-diphosphatase
MRETAFSSFLARIDTADYRLCRRLNRAASRSAIRRPFQIASRLGDGVVWYVLILLLPVIFGMPAVRAAIVMALTGLLGVMVYAVLKRVFVRERPFIRHRGISQAAAPLDRYSFPSGHTLHAVSFAWQASVHFPQLAWWLVPLAAMIAVSRLILGLHYPTDVLAGAFIGACIAQLGLAFT